MPVLFWETGASPVTVLFQRNRGPIGRNSETRLFLPLMVRLSERRNGFNRPTHRQWHAVPMKNETLLDTRPAGLHLQCPAILAKRCSLFERERRSSRFVADRPVVRCTVTKPLCLDSKREEQIVRLIVNDAWRPSSQRTEGDAINTWPVETLAT
ncbi:hypothetical protein LZ32DRAFT_366903 [Colletotrichum eremochloae]|nr:hypothetical protein LZ32DRAFT_366903 [Colletotrichum eremochloae]